LATARASANRKPQTAPVTYPLDLPLWLERSEIAEEQRLQHIAEHDLPDDWQPDPEDAAPWWRTD